MSNLQEVDTLLIGRVETLNNVRNNKWLMLFIFNLPFILRAIMEEVIWNLTDGFAAHKYFLYINFNRYYCFASNILMLYINVLLNKRYVCLTRVLCGLFKQNNVIEEIRLVKKVFGLLSSVVKLYSNIFGLQIFFELLYMHMAMLQRLVGNLKSNTVATSVFSGNGNRIFQYLSLDGIIFNIVCKIRLY